MGTTTSLNRAFIRSIILEITRSVRSNSSVVRLVCRSMFSVGSSITALADLKAAGKQDRVAEQVANVQGEGFTAVFMNEAQLGNRADGRHRDDRSRRYCDRGVVDGLVRKSADNGRVRSYRRPRQVIPYRWVRV